ncbi:MAG: O-antigen ligase family protein [Thermoleophilia bacterium]|nr:O-antigen ligase family protein [Thermoleophilia bacterium]
MILAAAPAVEVLIVVALALATAGWLLAVAPRPRAAAGLGVLLLAPVALLVSVTGDNESSLPHFSPMLIAAGLVAGALALTLAAACCLRFSRWVIPAALIALPLRVPLVVGGDSVKLLLPLYLVIAGAVVAEVWKTRHGDALPVRAPRRLDMLLAAFFVLYALQSAYSPDAAVAMRNFAFFYAPFALLYGIAANQRWDAALLRACATAVVVLALLLVGAGFVEYARGQYLIRPGGIKPNDFDPYFRIQSLFFDPNIFGRFVALVMLTVAALMIYTKRTSRVFAAAAVLAVLWAGLVLTLSQSSFAALLAGLVVLAAMRWNTRRVLTVTGVIAFAGLTFALAVPSVSGIDLRNSRSAETTTSGRFDLVTGGVKLWGERPLVGHGSGGFAAAFERGSLAADSAFGSPTTTKSHTAPLTVAAEQGALGLAVFLALLWTAFSAVYRRAGADGQPGVVARAAVAAAFTALFVHSLAYAALFEDPLSWMLLGMAVSLAAIPLSGTDEAEPAESAAAEAAAA